MEEADADLRQACFLFGEKLVYLRRAGVNTAPISAERWVEFFRVAGQNPVLRQAWDLIVRAMAAAPGKAVSSLVTEAGLGVKPDDWRARVQGVVSAAASRAYSPEPERIFRLAVGGAMAFLRGRVPAAEVIAQVREEVGGEA